MARWRLTPHSETVLANWNKTATPAHRQRLAEVLETIGDGTWKDRWWNQPSPAVKDATEVRAGDGLILIARKFVDRGTDQAWIELRGVWVVEDDEADLWDLPDR